MAIDISVVIPAYNSSATIEECILSCISECEKCKLEYEIIIVDDGSKDNTLDILRKNSINNPHLVIIAQKNSGPSSARNNGMKNARGKYIAFNDSDDRWIEGRLKKQIDFLENNPEIALVSSQYADTIRSKKIIEINFKKEMFHNYFTCTTSVFRKEIATKYLFPENMKYSEDMRFYLTILCENRCVYLPILASKCITGKNQFGESGLSSRLGKMEKGELSNILFALKKRKITFIIFLCAIIYSVLKFLRRCLFSIKYKK